MAEKRTTQRKSNAKAASDAKTSAAKRVVRTKSGRLVMTSPAKSSTSRRSWSTAFAKA